MDSGNTSGSIQSSSGGDEEYDSRAAAAAAAAGDSMFFTNNTQNDAVHHHHHHHSTQSQQPNLFDPLSNLFDRNPNLDFANTMVWPRPVRSDPAASDLVPSAHLLCPTARSPLPNLPPPMHITGIPAGAGTIGSSSSASATAERSSEPGSSGGVGGVARNPKKRSRASRRAPTTVLTTDTTNFRAMVQEFTGIPAPPFASSPFPRTRFDLFGSGSGLRLDHLAASSSSSTNSPTTIASASTTAPSPYNLLRPFAQKVRQTTPFAPNASSYSNLLSQNPPGHGHPVLSFNSLLQPSLKDHQTTSFGLNPHAGLQSLVATATANEAANWGASNDNNISGNDNSSAVADEGFLRSINANSDLERQEIVSNGKLSYTATAAMAAEFSSNKGSTENVAARSEGMVESWICSSD